MVNNDEYINNMVILHVLRYTGWNFRSDLLIFLGVKQENEAEVLWTHCVSNVRQKVGRFTVVTTHVMRLWQHEHEDST